MKILAVDTTRDELLVMLIKDGQTFARVNSAGKKGHSSSLMPFIDGLMAEAFMLPNELDAVCAVTGAGSFTGIRIGVAAMNAIAFATGAKRIEVNSFELLSNGESGKVLCTVPAQNGNVFGGVCEDGKLTETGFWTAEELPVCEKTVKQEDFCDFSNALETVVKAKYARGEFVTQLRPLYLRKSQAERNKDDTEKA